VHTLKSRGVPIDAMSVIAGESFDNEASRSARARNCPEGVAIGSTAGGAVVGAGIGAVVPDHEVNHYEDAAQKGSVIVGMKCEDDDRKEVVRETLKNFKVDKTSRVSSGSSHSRQGLAGVLFANGTCGGNSTSQLAGDIIRHSSLIATR